MGYSQILLVSARTGTAPTSVCVDDCLMGYSQQVNVPNIIVSARPTSVCVVSVWTGTKCY